MSADRKAAFETATQWVGLRAEGLVNPPADNLAAAYLELHANLEKFRQAEIRWMDEAAAKDAELEQERKAREEAEKQLLEAQCLAVPRDILERYESLIVCKDYSDLGKLGVRLLSMTHVMPYDIDGIVREHIRQRQEAEQRAANLQARLDRVEASTIERCAKAVNEITRFGSFQSKECYRVVAECERAIRALRSQPNAATQSEQSVQAPSGGQPQESAPAAALLHDLYVWREQDSVAGNGEYYQGLMCGVEDRGFQKDGYSAMHYGYDAALERVAEYIDPIIEQLIAAAGQVGIEPATKPDERSPEPAPSAAPDAALPGLELAKEIAFAIGKDGTLKHEGAIDVYKAICAEIERRRNKA